MGFNYDLLKGTTGKSVAGMFILAAQKDDKSDIIDLSVVYMDASAKAIVKAPADISADLRYLKATQCDSQNAFFIVMKNAIKAGGAHNFTTRLNTFGKGVTSLYYELYCLSYNDAIAKLGDADAPKHDDAIVVFVSDSDKKEADTNLTTTDYFANWGDSYFLMELVDRDGTEDLKFISANEGGAHLLFVEFETLIGSYYCDYEGAKDWAPFYIDVAKTGAYIINEAYNHVLGRFMSCMVFSPAVGLATMIAVDRTSIWEKEQSLRGRADDMASLFASMTTGLCIGKLIRDDEGKAFDMRFETVNLRYELINGYPSGSVQGKLLSELVGNDSNFYKYVEIADNMSKMNYNKYIPLSGATVEVHCYSQGDDVVVFSENDVTEKVKAEQALAKSQAQLATQLQTINESIEYASVIQRNILPDADLFKQVFTDFSIRWDPRDVVGGDMYWIKTFEAGTVLVLADCTGHGTPGALLTMLVASAFEDMVNEENCHDPAQLIWNLEQRLLGIFGARSDVAGASLKDGCDLAVMFIAKDKSISLSSCNTSVFVCDGEKVERVKGQYIFIGEGKLQSKDELNVMKIPYNENNKFYLSSDGLFEQPGGEKERKYGYRKFEKLILENHKESQTVISDKIWDAFEKFKGSHRRVDDYELISFKL